MSIPLVKEVIVLEHNKTLPPYMQIQRVVIRETEFPKTTTKKIKRSAEVS